MPEPERARLATVLHLVLKAGKLAQAAAPAKPARRFRDRPVAESLNLKKPGG